MLLTDACTVAYPRGTAQTLTVPAVAEPLLVLVLSGSALVQERAIGQDWVASAVSADDFFLTN
ncbi:hypothetical protein [Pseudomonas sp. DSP3-2-2]|uniref:hypothetical protein n=1 Tax=unclassified Pseudomonas TaxID=196821 RepID=UPI003CF64CF5